MNEGDRKWIEDAIFHYDKKFPYGPDSIAATVVSAKHEQTELERDFRVNNKSGIIGNNEAGRHLSLVIPENLYAVLKYKYPRLFTEHIKWFKRNFPMFVLENKEYWGR